MKRLVSLLFFSTLGFCHGGPDYSSQFNAQFDRQDFTGMEKTLQDWHQSNTGDVEWLVASGDYDYLKARDKAPALTASEQQTPVVWFQTPVAQTDPPAPNPDYFNRPLMSQAVTCWQKALFLCPWRLDLYFKLSRLFQDAGDFQAQYDTLANGLQYMDKNRRNLKWVDPKLLPLSATIPPRLHEPIAFYLGQGQPEARDKAHRLIRLAITFYPNDAYFYNSLAAYYSTKEDWPHTMKYLLIASGKDPRESLYVFNIGNALAGMGKKREAGIFYRQVVKRNQYPDCVEVAKNFLETTGKHSAD